MSRMYGPHQPSNLIRQSFGGKPHLEWLRGFLVVNTEGVNTKVSSQQCKHAFITNGSAKIISINHITSRHKGLTFRSSLEV
eukprot:7713627-Pyramimonas_sp.AAC.2